jgi:hypothetical protein
MGLVCSRVQQTLNSCAVNDVCLITFKKYDLVWLQHGGHVHMLPRIVTALVASTARFKKSITKPHVLSLCHRTALYTSNLFSLAALPQRLLRTLHTADQLVAISGLNLTSCLDCLDVTTCWTLLFTDVTASPCFSVKMSS